MIRVTQFFLLLALFLSACNTKPIEKVSISKKVNISEDISSDEENLINDEINNLSNYADKNEYLEMIFNLDQNIRINNDAELDIGSKAEKMHYKKMDSIDRLNYGRIDLYLSKFGYPNLDSVSAQASAAPWLVLHHSDLSKRLRHFKTLSEAYKNGNIDVMKYDAYLGRTYRMKYGKYPKWEGPYKPEEKVEWLVKELRVE